VYIPNIISVIRLFLAPFVIWLIITQSMLGAFIVFLVAGVTDALDGFIARRFHLKTELGAYLDPIADKALLMSTYIALGLTPLYVVSPGTPNEYYLPTWLVILVVSRDVLIIGAFMLSWLMGREVEVKPLIISKLNTLMQIALAVLVLGAHGLNLELNAYIIPTIWVTGATTALSAIAYLVTWLRYMASYDINTHTTPRTP
jgi:cardiolipin synthase (CMP-forming)